MSKLIIILSVFFACALPLAAQSKHDWKGFYVGGDAAVSKDDSTASATLNIIQISGLFVTSRGIVIVPGTTIPFAVPPVQNSNCSNLCSVLSSSRRKNNFSGSFQAGYQWQARKFVFGGEGDFTPFRRTFTASENQQIPTTSLTPVSTVTSQRDTRFSQEFALLGRAGVAFGKTLVYGTIGYDTAKARLTSTDTFNDPGGPAAPNICVVGASGCVCLPNGTTAFGTCTTDVGRANFGPASSTTIESESSRMGGLTFGFGAERKFGKRLSVGLEYRRVDYRSETFTLGNPTVTNVVNATTPAAGTTTTGTVYTGPTLISLKSDSFGVRINFHF